MPWYPRGWEPQLPGHPSRSHSRRSAALMLNLKIAHYSSIPTLLVKQDGAWKPPRWVGRQERAMVQTCVYLVFKWESTLLYRHRIAPGFLGRKWVCVDALTEFCFVLCQCWIPSWKSTEVAYVPALLYFHPSVFEAFWSKVWLFFHLFEKWQLKCSRSSEFLYVWS